MPWARTSRRNSTTTRHDSHYMRTAPPPSNASAAPRGTSARAPSVSSRHGNYAQPSSNHGRTASNHPGTSAHQSSHHGRTAPPPSRYAASVQATNPPHTHTWQSRSYAGSVASRAYSQRPPFSQGARTAASMQRQLTVPNQTRGQGGASAAGSRSRAPTAVQTRGADRGRSVVPASDVGGVGGQGGQEVVGYAYETVQVGGRRGSRWSRFRMFVWRRGSRK
ncbi:hypothetical protein COCMIDRAFT_94091 [Bipolaris oryzae ATCC 44560]|uniref:Uncharacterized protein n=1 Tax=Bipolaris oryzae ATCC 44560 TaxID=930090 RepID=W6Z2F8_COCMI|nr:uncharacterized protein COCMIDRAFT_94091 [Bipolaris oryzae ATCC 44560]EUC45937.1 hypothetical protein COCMIDRAFT_94091 [Bipolaris oryzae ATCC 44560]